MPSPTRVLVVDDHAMVRDGLVAILNAEDDLEVVGSADGVETAHQEIRRCTPDVVVTDFQLPDGSGFDVAAAASAAGARVLLISAVVDGRVAVDAVQAGCTGFVHKGHQTRELAAAVRTVAAGGAVFPAEAMQQLIRSQQPKRQPELSDRELEVLRLLARPMTVNEIAAELYISVHTARNHLRSIMAKLEARSQLEAVVLAVRAGVIELDG